MHESKEIFLLSVYRWIFTCKSKQSIDSPPVIHLDLTTSPAIFMLDPNLLLRERDTSQNDILSSSISRNIVGNIMTSSGEIHHSASTAGNDDDVAVSLTWNKSCLPCRMGKRKCDGLRPCSRCLRRDRELECTYERRKIHKRRELHKNQKQHESMSRSSRHKKAPDMENVVDLCHEMTAVGQGNSVCDAGFDLLQCSHFDKLKRCHFTASPATGLVGMAENYFLSDYFDCMGLIPLVTRSEIRETIVKMMSVDTKRRKRVPSTSSCNDGNEKSATFASERVRVLSTCAFWSAVAIGALSRGRRTELVENYIFLAKDALRRSGSAPTVELARAWMLVGHIDGLSGDLEGFQRCMKWVDKLVHECRQRGQVQELPLWLIVSLQKRDMVKLLKEYDTAAAESFCSQEAQPTPEANIISTNEGAYVSLVHFNKKLDQMMYGFWDSSATRVRPEADKDLNGEVEDIVDVDPFEVDGLRDSLPETKSLELIVQWPILRNGFGGFLMNTSLAIVKSAKRDDCNALGHLRAAVEVLGRYPGILRYIVGVHTAHRVAIALITIADPEARQLYERVRTEYNRVRLPESPSIPPFGEWQGVHAFCDNPVCRVMELLCRPPHGIPQSIGNSERTAKEQSRGISGGYDTRDISDGVRGEWEGEGHSMESMLRSAWGDLQWRPINTTRDEVQYTAAKCGGKVLAATLEIPRCDSAPDANVSTLAGNGYNEMFPGVDEIRTVSTVPPPVCCGEIDDQAMSITMLERHQEGWVDSSLIDPNSRNICKSADISAEDWLHVAKDPPALPR